MKRLIVAFMFFATTAHAFEIQDGRYPLDMGKNFTNQTNVTVKVVSDIDKACNQERVNKGYAKNTYKVDACSFWTGNQCTIVVPKNINLEILGHEMAHCLQGSWH